MEGPGFYSAYPQEPAKGFELTTGMTSLPLLIGRSGYHGYNGQAAVEIIQAGMKLLAPGWGSGYRGSRVSGPALRLQAAEFRNEFGVKCERGDGPDSEIRGLNS